ncbi:TPA: hypothetical protein QCU37_005527 [Bacillus cereus]|nr:hypothetical protein [Bacillus cereus]
MKARELIEYLKGILNQVDDVLVVRGMTKVDKLLVFLNNKHESLCISTEVFEKDIYIKLSKTGACFVK